MGGTTRNKFEIRMTSSIYRIESSPDIYFLYEWVKSSYFPAAVASSPELFQSFGFQTNKKINYYFFEKINIFMLYFLEKELVLSKGIFYQLSSGSFFLLIKRNCVLLYVFRVPNNNDRFILLPCFAKSNPNQIFSKAFFLKKYNWTPFVRLMSCWAHLNVFFIFIFNI